MKSPQSVGLPSSADYAALLRAHDHTDKCVCNLIADYIDALRRDLIEIAEGAYTLEEVRDIASAALNGRRR